MCSSPRLLAAYHGLLRTVAPRHPPWTLSRLTIFSVAPRCSFRPALPAELPPPRFASMQPDPRGLPPADLLPPCSGTWRCIACVRSFRCQWTNLTLFHAAFGCTSAPPPFPTGQPKLLASSSALPLLLPFPRVVKERLNGLPLSSSAIRRTARSQSGSHLPVTVLRDASGGMGT